MTDDPAHNKADLPAYHGGSDNWQTVAFTVLTLSQLAHALAVRSERDSLLSIGLCSNRPLLGAVVFAAPLQPIFKTTGLTSAEMVVCLTLPLVVLIAVEIEKWLVRRGLLYSSSDKI